MDTYFDIILKGITSVLILLFFTKLMGRKQVGELNILDYIIGISIGSIAAEMTMNDEVEFMEGALGIAIYAILAYLISFITMKSIIARRLIIGTPTIIIQKGKILEKNMKKAKIDINDILEQARINGCFDISEIEYAIMEANGNLSFLKKGKHLNLTPEDMKIKSENKGLVANLIIDGKVIKENLKAIKKDEKWLFKRIENMGYKDIKNIILLTCDIKEKITIYEKNMELEEIKILE